jgi:hypothetical protein
VCKKNYMLFYKKHKNDTKYMHCSRSRYMKVVNEDGASVTTKVVVKKLHYMPITPLEETVKQMRWHKEEKRDSEDSDIMSNHVNREAW